MSSATTRNHPMRGIVLRLAAIMCFAVMSAAMKVASADNVSALEMLFYRSIIGLPILLAWLATGPGLESIGTKRPLAHLGRSVIGISAILMNFQALILLPLADAATIGFTSPIFATLLSGILLGERIGIHRWTAVLLGFAGVAIIIQPGGHQLPHAGIAFALMGAAGTAGVTVTIRQLGGTEHPGAIVFWFFLSSAIVSGIGMLFYGQAHSSATFAILLIAATAGAGAQLLMTLSLQVAPVSVVAPFDYTQIIWASLLGWAIWADLPAGTTLAGGALICASGLYTALREHRLRKDLAAATPPLE